MRPGSTDEAAQVELTNFEVNREINAALGQVEVTAKATIRDLRTGEEVVLIDGERLYESETTVRLKSEEDTAFLAELTQVGESFTGPIGKYVLREINLEAGTVIVDKEKAEGVEAETRVLSVESSTLQDEPLTESEISSQPQSFDYPFPF